MDKQKDTQRGNAFRRLLIVLAVAIGFIIYSYGWTVTDINLERPQEPQRQQNVTSALQQLLSPNIFEQEREVVNIYANFRVGCVEGETIEQPEIQNFEGATVRVEPPCAEAGETILLTVENFAPLAEGRIRWDPVGLEGQSRPREVIETGREDFVFGAAGSFTGSIEVPRIRGTDGDMAQIVVRAAVASGPVELSNTSEQVLMRMAETIFMALVATTVAIPIAAMISFFAARNLMAPIKLSVGSILLSFLGFALGVWLGALILAPIADLGIEIGRGAMAGPLFAFIAPVVVVGLMVVLSRLLISKTIPSKENYRTPAQQARSAITRVIFALMIIFLVGNIGGLGLMGSEQIGILAGNIREGGSPIIADAVGAIGNLLRVLSELVELFTVMIGAVVGGFVVSGLLSDLFAGPLRKVDNVTGSIIGAIFGLLSGAILMGVIGIIGTWAALLGLLSPIIASFIGGQIPVLLYNRFTPDRAVHEITTSNKVIQQILYFIGAVITFVLVFEFLNTGRAIIDGTLPPQTTRTILGMEVTAYVFNNMIVGAILGGVAGLLAGVKANFPAGSILYTSSRALLNTVRSIEPLIMGLVFVIWVGIGPFAGVLALTLHSIAALGKLYSEQVENIDDGPIEALESTGANRLQTIIYAVVPQIIPPYIAFTMYRWDINVRMSTIIGFVGGGGIGLLLQQQINLLRYRDAGVAVLAIAVVVSILDYASASIRSRIT